MSKKFTDLIEKTKNLASNQFDRAFDYTKLKAGELKDSIDMKIQKMALKNLKEILAIRNKTLEDYSDEDIEVMLHEEKIKIKDRLKTLSLTGALALLGLDFLV